MGLIYDYFDSAIYKTDKKLVEAEISDGVIKAMLLRCSPNSALTQGFYIQ